MSSEHDNEEYVEDATEDLSETIESLHDQLCTLYEEKIPLEGKSIAEMLEVVQGLQEQLDVIYREREENEALAAQLGIKYNSTADLIGLGWWFKRGSTAVSLRG